MQSPTVLRRLASIGVGDEFILPEIAGALLCRWAIVQIGKDLGQSLNDVNMFSADDVSGLHLSIVSDLAGDVLVLWLAEKSGAVLPFAVVSEHWEELWLPSSDDLLIIGSTLSSFLLISHEEDIVSGTLP
jgi:hypothetical protein